MAELIWGVITVILFAGLIVCLVHISKLSRLVRYLKKDWKNERISPLSDSDKEIQERLRKRAQMYALQNQINPHFLYNTLDSIRSKALMEGQDEIASMTEILARFFRYCIAESNNLVKAGEELSHIKDYYYIQKYRFEDRFDMNISLEDDGLVDMYMPRMTLQPIVENALMHGLEHVMRKGILEIRMETVGDRFVITVADNGIGMDEQTLISMNKKMNSGKMPASSGGKHGGIAVSNVNARLKMIFGDSYGIFYRSLKNAGTDCVISLPIVDDFSRNKYENKI